MSTLPLDIVSQLTSRFQRVRSFTETLAARLSPEDQQLQSMPSASPTKWHRAHTTWFFETFILMPAGVRAFDERFGYLFNSYYQSVGERALRAHRGLVSRPTADEVMVYRNHVDAQIEKLLTTSTPERLAPLRSLIEVGLAHEEQHQELLLTDILHAFSCNPLGPAYLQATLPKVSPAPALRWTEFEGGVHEIGAFDTGFSFDNELPRHQVLLQNFAVASRTVTVGELKAFIREHGYLTPSLWLSQGYELCRQANWTAPLYAQNNVDGFRVFSLHGWRTPSDNEPASHLSFWEADAIARFLDARLPTEAEWEHAAASHDPDLGNFSDGPLVPLPRGDAAVPAYFGNVWEWTRSSYDPYPGYRPAEGALGEYNGKFMAQQLVLRGGSCLTPPGHIRASYRNFWPPDTQFQMTGVRLARDASPRG